MVDYVLNRLDKVEKRLNKQNDINRALSNNSVRCVKYALFVGIVCLAHSVKQGRSISKDFHDSMTDQETKIADLETRLEELEKMKG